MTIRGVAGKIPCKPFPSLSLNVKSQTLPGGKKGVLVFDQKVNMQALEVLLHYKSASNPLLDLCPGDTVYVYGDRYAVMWAKEKYKIAEDEFILVPENEVLLIQSKG